MKFSFIAKLLLFSLIVVILVLSMIGPVEARIRKKNMEEGVVHLVMPYKSRDIAPPTTAAEDWTAFPIGNETQGGDIYKWAAPYDGHIIGIAIYADVAVTAGYMEVEPTVNGVRTGLQAKLDTTNTKTHYKTQRHNLDKVSAGDEIGVDISFDALLNGFNTTDVSVMVIFGEARE